MTLSIQLFCKGQIVKSVNPKGDNLLAARKLFDWNELFLKSLWSVYSQKVQILYRGVTYFRPLMISRKDTFHMHSVSIKIILIASWVFFLLRSILFLRILTLKKFRIIKITCCFLENLYIFVSIMICYYRH